MKSFIEETNRFLSFIEDKRESLEMVVSEEIKEVLAEEEEIVVKCETIIIILTINEDDRNKDHSNSNNNKHVVEDPAHVEVT